MRGFIAVTLLLASIAAAHAFGLGKEGLVFGKLGAVSKSKATLQPTGKILLVDGVSHILFVDGVSKICRAGGC